MVQDGCLQVGNNTHHYRPRLVRLPPAGPRGCPLGDIYLSAAKSFGPSAQACKLLPPFQNRKENVSQMKTTFAGYENDSELFFFFFLYISVLIPSLLVLLYNNGPRDGEYITAQSQRNLFPGNCPHTQCCARHRSPV